MNKYFDKLEKKATKKRSRTKKRTELVGSDTVAKQDSRAFNEKAKAAFTKGDSATKAKGREAIKRVGEYKKGEFQGFAHGGKVTCKGMGAAKRGGMYKG